jgi:hypothetical protein
MSGPVTPRQWEVYEQRRQRGWGVSGAAREAGISQSSAWRREKWLRGTAPQDRWPMMDAGKPQAPVERGSLPASGVRALDDFGFFQRRFMGRIATPWQVLAANAVLGWLESPVKEFVVINAPPGSGKTTLFTHDLPAWLTVRNRAIRGLVGSRTSAGATRYVQRLKRTFEATVPMLGEGEEIALGLALDAEATLADDFGAFRPPDKDQWAGDAFVVAQLGGRSIAEKEPTWSAYGQEAGFLGMRYDFIVWDDVVDLRSMRTIESRQSQQEWWDDVAEKRLEPGGLLVLQGQRLGADDLYRYALDKRLFPEGEDLTMFEPEARAAAATPAKYHHLVFKAHYPDRCQGEHSTDAPYYPEGCLLDPRRLPWRELRAEMSNPRHNFEVLYQQEDVDPSSVLVDALWVTGGVDPLTGESFPGCVDKDRGIADLPQGLAGELLSVCTVDPSAVKWWSIQWWVVRCVDGVAFERYLMDHVRQKMDAPGFLDWSESTRSFYGLAEEWQQRSKKLEVPIGCWIVEANAAQRYMLQFEHMRRWLAYHRISLIPHQTAANKSDENYGVQTMGPIYRAGLVRLPYRTGAPYLASQKLIDEVCHYPSWRTDDCVMAQWFLEWHLPHLIPTGKPLPRMNRPSWLRGTSTFGARREAKLKALSRA